MTIPLPKPVSRPYVTGAWEATVVSHDTVTGMYVVTVPGLTGAGNGRPGTQAIGSYSAGGKVWVTPIRGNPDRLLIIGART